MAVTGELKDKGESITEQREPTAASNDPWAGSAASEDATNSFTDDFKPFVPLPDSAEYLAGLESKLARVQKKGSMVRDLQKKREDEMRRFLDAPVDSSSSSVSNASAVESSDSLATPVIDNAVVRKIAPERQVLNPEEAVILVKADSLAVGRTEKDDDPPGNKEDEKPPT